MPGTIYAKVVFEGRSQHEVPDAFAIDLSCVRQLLVDVSTKLPAALEAAFGTHDIAILLESWRMHGLSTDHIPRAVERLRQAAFDAESLGEALVDLRNRDQSPDIAPGVIPVLSAILDHFGCACGANGTIWLIMPDIKS